MERIDDHSADEPAPKPHLALPPASSPRRRWLWPAIAALILVAILAISDVTAAERNVAAANEQIGVAKAALFPVLSLSASGGFQSTSLAQWLTLPSRFWSVGPQLAATLFDAGKRRAQIDLQEAAYDALAATYRQTVLTALQQVEDQLAALRILEREADVQSAAVAAAQESLNISTEQYRAGTTDYLQVITTQTVAFQSERAAVDILTPRLTASVLLVEALGGGWDGATSAPPSSPK